jgi:hypothetical protein
VEAANEIEMSWPERRRGRRERVALGGIIETGILKSMSHRLPPPARLGGCQREERNLLAWALR